MPLVARSLILPRYELTAVGSRVRFTAAERLPDVAPKTKMGPKPRPIADRMAENIRIDPSGCWIWTGVIGSDGYGKINLGSKADGTHAMYQVHRVVWAMTMGLSDPPKDVDHQCHNEEAACPGGPTCLHRRCVRPSHLREATRGENLRAGRGLAASKAAQTHCIRGHLFDETNTYIAANGTRKCRACRNLRAREYRARA